jgi:hypothetical protein
MFFMLQVFYIVGSGASGLGARRAKRPADGGAVVGVRWGRARPQLLIPTPECCPCGERGGGQGRSAGTETWRRWTGQAARASEYPDASHNLIKK